MRLTTLEVLKEAENVKINYDKIGILAKKWAKQNLSSPSWPKEYLPKTKNQRTLLDYLIILDAINFCFWSKKDKWEIFYKGKFYDGYFAFALALKRFFEENPNKANFYYFSKISFKEFNYILRGRGELLLLKKRWKILRAVSKRLFKKYGGDSIKFILSANHYSSILLQKIVHELPFFGDINYYDNHKVYFLKRAQLLISDIWGVFDGKGIGWFKDLDYLTAFADYKIPQVLRNLGILEFEEDLEDKIDNKKLIPAGSKEEIEIRSATIWVIEYLQQALKKEGKKFYSFQIDWLFWNKSQLIKPDFPHHLTKTIFY